MTYHARDNLCFPDPDTPEDYLAQFAVGTRVVMQYPGGREVLATVLVNDAETGAFAVSHQLESWIDGSVIRLLVYPTPRDVRPFDVLLDSGLSDVLGTR